MLKETAALLDAVDGDPPQDCACDTAQATKRMPSDPLLGILTSADTISAIFPEWQKLAQRALGHTAFQSVEWAQAALAAISQERQPCVITLTDGGTLIAIAPFQLEKLTAMTCLTGLAEPYQQYTEILIDPEYDVQAVGEALREHIRRVGADFVHFRQVRADAALQAVIGDRLSPVGEPDGAPLLQLADWENFEAYLKSISARSRKTIRNLRNRLVKSAPLTHRIIRHNETDLKPLILRTLAQREQWVERMGYSSRALDGEGMEAFLEALCQQAPQGAELVALELKHGDVPLSTEWGLLFNGCYYAYMADWNPDYEQYSPGKLHQMDVIEACFEMGVTTIDFLKPASRYKLTWTSEVVPVVDYVFPLSWKGRLYTQVWLNQLRPAAKRLVLALPQNLRAPLMKLAKQLLSRA